MNLFMIHTCHGYCIILSVKYTSEICVTNSFTLIQYKNDINIRYTYTVNTVNNYIHCNNERLFVPQVWFTRRTTRNTKPTTGWLWTSSNISVSERKNIIEGEDTHGDGKVGRLFSKHEGPEFQPDASHVRSRVEHSHRDNIGPTIWLQRPKTAAAQWLHARVCTQLCLHSRHHAVGSNPADDKKENSYR